MHDKSPSSCVCGDDVAYLGGDVVSVSSAILGFTNLPRYSQSAESGQHCRANRIYNLFLKYPAEQVFGILPLRNESGAQKEGMVSPA